MPPSPDWNRAHPGSGFSNIVFMDTFQLIVLRGQKPRAVLERQAEALRRLMTETGAPCWLPDPPSTGPCQVQMRAPCAAVQVCQ